MRYRLSTLCLLSCLTVCGHICAQNVSRPESAAASVNKRRETQPSNTTSSPATFPALIRWAVVSGVGTQSVFPDLITTQLTGTKGIELVERDEVASVMGELSVSAVLSPSGGQDRLKLGQLLRADGLVLLERQPEPTTQSATAMQPGIERWRVILCECRQGTRLRIEFVTFPPNEVAHAAESVASLVRETHDRFINGIRCAIGVSNLISKTLIHDYDDLQATLAYVLQGAFESVPGVAVIEVEEARAIQQERSLAVGPQTQRIVPLIVAGEYRVDEQGENATAAIRVEVSDADRIVHSLQKDGVSLAQLGPLLRVEALVWAKELSHASTTHVLSVDEQIAFMVHQADSFALLGGFEHAAGLREACLLLNPDLHDQRIKLVDEFRYLLSPRPSGVRERYLKETPQLLEHVEKRILLWRTCLLHLEYLIRHVDVPSQRILTLCQSLQQEARDVWMMRDPYEKDGSGRRSHLERMEAIKMDFLERIFPLLLPRVTGREWQNVVIDWSQTPFGPVYYDSPEFPALTRALTRILPTTQPVERSAVEAVQHLSRNHCSWGNIELHESEVRSFLQALIDSDVPRNHVLARVGLLWHELCVVERDQRIPPAGMYSAVQDLLSDCENSIQATEIGAPAFAIQEAQALDRRLKAIHAPPSPSTRKARNPATRPAPSNTIRRSSKPDDSPPKVPAIADRVPFQLIDKAGNSLRLMGRKWMYLGMNNVWLPDLPPLRLTACGKTLDVFWNSNVILVHRTPGILQELLLAPNGEFTDVVWDGHQVWIAGVHHAIQFLSMDGELNGTIGRQEGLPPCEKGLKLLALEPGRVFATGAFGDPVRGWIAEIKLGTKPVVRILHEAKEVAPTDYFTTAGVNAGFCPSSIHLDSRDKKVMVNRCSQFDFDYAPGISYDALVFQPESGQVMVSKEQRSEYDSPPGPYYFENGGWLSGGQNPRYHSPGEKDHAEPQYLRVNNFHFRTKLIPMGDWVYLPSRENWLRMHAKTMAEQELSLVRSDGGGVHEPDQVSQSTSELPQLFENARELDAGVSAHLGLVVWDDKHEFYRLHVDEANAPPPIVTIKPQTRSPNRPPTNVFANKGNWWKPFAEYLAEAVPVVIGITGVVLGILSLHGARKAWRNKIRVSVTLAALGAAGFICAGSSIVWIASTFSPLDREEFEPLSPDSYTHRPVSDLLNDLAEPNRRIDAIAEFSRRINQNLLTEGERQNVADALTALLGETQSGSEIYRSLSSALTALLRLGALSGEQVNRFLQDKESGPIRCRYDPIGRRIYLTGSTHRSIAQASGPVCIRSLSLIEGGTPVELLYTCATGDWTAVAQASRERAPQTVRLTSTWLDVESTFDCKEFCSASIDEQRRILSQIRGNGGSRVLTTHHEDRVLNQSDFQLTLFDQRYWTTVVFDGPSIENSADVLDTSAANASGASAGVARPPPLASGPQNAVSTNLTGETGSGVVVLLTMRDSQANRLGIEPGDVILSLENEPVNSVDVFTDISKGIQDRQRRVRVRHLDQERTLEAWPGKLGIYLATFREPSGRELISAVRAFHEGHSTEACDHFSQLLSQGSTFEKGTMTRAIYAECLYYAGRFEQAKEQMRQDQEGWESLAYFFEHEQPNDTLCMFACNEWTRQEPTPAAFLARAECLFRVRRYPEVIACARKATAHAPKASELRQSLLLQQKAFYLLGLASESVEIARKTLNEPETIWSWPTVSYVAEACGQSALASDFSRAVFDEYHLQGADGRWTRDALRLYIQSGKMAPARDFVGRILADWEISALLDTSFPAGFGGADAADLWQTIAHRAMPKIRSRTQAERIFDALLLQSEPRVDELQKILSPSTIPQDLEALNGPWLAHAQAALALLRGDYAGAARILANLSEDSGFIAERNAAHFLQAHASSLTGPHAQWLRTLRAWPMSDGRVLLLTRDWQMGLWSNGEAVRPLPLPASAWWISDPDQAVAVSAIGRNILAVNQWLLYKLDVSTSAWQPIVHIPWHMDETFKLTSLTPVLDQLVDVLSATKNMPSIIEPESPEEISQASMPILLLSNGDWLVCDLGHRRVVSPRGILSPESGKPVEIYDIVSVDSKSTRLLLFTNAGLFDWDLSKGAPTEIQLPPAAGDTSIVRTSDAFAVPRGSIRIARLPRAGGATMLFDVDSGKIRTDVLVNENYPRSIWSYLSDQAKRHAIDQTTPEPSG